MIIGGRRKRYHDRRFSCGGELGTSRCSGPANYQIGFRKLGDHIRYISPDVSRFESGSSISVPHFFKIGLTCLVSYPKAISIELRQSGDHRIIDRLCTLRTTEDKQVYFVARVRLRDLEKFLSNRIARDHSFLSKERQRFFKSERRFIYKHREPAV